MDYSKGAFRSETGRTRAQTRTRHGDTTSPTQRPFATYPLPLAYIQLVIFALSMRENTLMAS